MALWANQDHHPIEKLKHVIKEACVKRIIEGRALEYIDDLVEGEPCQVNGLVRCRPCYISIILEENDLPA